MASNRRHSIHTFGLCILIAPALANMPLFGQQPESATSEEQDFIQIAEHADHAFEFAGSGEAFHPFGFNYDHDGDGRLIEDYWHDDWQAVVDDFHEMHELGANVARIHLQFGRFMNSPTEANSKELAQLKHLLELAEETGMYLDLTGLGCYHKQDVPEWYDALDEQDRWNAQGEFWEAIARTCAESPAVFCYDLMNEPVVPGGDEARDDWLAGAFAGKHFVQFIALDRAGRDRSEVAKAWVDQLVDAIRKHDERHLITLGFVPWSLDRPGLTSGFVPARVSQNLDFLAVHLYPESDKIDEAIATLRGFDAVGKPVIVEEFFPLKCSLDELKQFMDRAGAMSDGWIGFYWGQTPDECRQSGTISGAITASYLEFLKTRTHDFKVEREH